MKTIAFIFIALLMISANANSQVVINDTTDTNAEQKNTQIKQQLLRKTPFGVSLSYQPAIGGDFFGLGLYLDNVFGPVGFYGSMTGLKKAVEGDADKVYSKEDSYFGYTVSKNWYPVNFGVTLQTATNFFIYFGFSTGDYSEWVTQTYSHIVTFNNIKTYTIVTEEKSASPGMDLGAKYYAGKGTVRFALQLGFNTSMKAVLAGIQMGFFVK